MEFPIIRIDVERMRHTLSVALMEHSSMLADEMQKAVSEYITDTNIKNVIHQQARQHIDAAVKEEVQNFFRYTGAGRAAIKEAVHQYLKLHFSED